MVKGVNKNIIEVNNPDSIYFEKAVFYLKPNVRRLPDEVSEREIERYISNLGLEVECRNKKFKAKTGRIIIYSAAALAILIIAVILI